MSYFYRDRSKELLRDAEAAGRASGLRGLDLLRHVAATECPWDQRVGKAAWDSWTDEIRAVERRLRNEDAADRGQSQPMLFG